MGSPAAGLGETPNSENHFSAKWPPHPCAEGGQVEPVGSKFIRTSTPMGCWTIYTVAFLRMEITSTINNAESTGAKNANIAGPANISGL